MCSAATCVHKLNLRVRCPPCFLSPRHGHATLSHPALLQYCIHVAPSYYDDSCRVSRSPFPPLAAATSPYTVQLSDSALVPAVGANIPSIVKSFPVDFRVDLGHRHFVFPSPATRLTPSIRPSSSREQRHGSRRQVPLSEGGLVTGGWLVAVSARLEGQHRHRLPHHRRLCRPCLHPLGEQNRTPSTPSSMHFTVSCRSLANLTARRVAIACIVHMPKQVYNGQPNVRIPWRPSLKVKDED